MLTAYYMMLLFNEPGAALKEVAPGFGYRTPSGGRNPGLGGKENDRAVLWQGRGGRGPPRNKS